MKKTIIILVILAIILGGGYYFYQRGLKQAQAPADSLQNAGNSETQNLLQQQSSLPENQTASTTPGGQNTASSSPPSGGRQGTFSAGAEADMGPDVLVTQVDFDGTSFSPASINIKVGDIVIFKNNSQEDFWPASNPHPIHTDYPEFDAKQAIPPGGKYQFKFTKAGNWGYHDHLNPSLGGVVNVSQ